MCVFAALSIVFLIFYLHLLMFIVLLLCFFFFCCWRSFASARHVVISVNCVVGISHCCCKWLLCC
jgi:hypothetical protein